MQFRLLHFWDARKNVKGGPGILLGIELLLIDAEGTVAQGFIGQNRRNQYEKELKRGMIYTLTNYYASNNKVMYHVADQRLVICISHASELRKVEEDIEAILTERFRIHSFADFEANCALRGDLHDVVGHLKLVDGHPLHERPILCIKDDSASRKVLVHLQLKDGPVINVYLWDEAAVNFRVKFDACADTPTVVLVTTVNPKRLGAPSDASSSSEATNNPILECPSCGALVWQSESTGRDPRTKELRFTICCNQGQIKLPPMRQPPPVLEKLLQCKQFRETIRVYNALLAFTSIGANIDYSVVFGRGPFTFRIQGQTYHRIGSLIPKPGLPPKYLQLYIFDTANEVKNRLEALGQTTSEGKATKATLKVLIEMVDTNNCLAKVFRRVRERYEANSEEDFTISLISDKGKGKQYDLPQSSEVVGLIVGEMSDTICERDIVVKFQSTNLTEIRDDHPLYMSLQYPLLFPYGEYGFNTEIPLHLEEGSSRTRKFVSIRQFYASQIQTRLKEGMTLIKSGRLLHQYVVDVYSSIEEDRLRWHRINQDVLRAELYSNVCDAVGKGDTDARTVGKRFILPPSFTGGPRYLIEKYHDAMAICRQFGNPDLFITMTANPNWKEIKNHLAAYGGDSPNDRPDIECRVFKMKLDQLLDDFKKGTFFAPYTAGILFNWKI
uniref:Helitron helicase-like domain-containing protein n=1 Tax=Brassica oleracea var. oleracea TaxID=109376 RepID=A0A0D3A349_BRAOL